MTDNPDWADEIANKLSPRKEAFGDAIADAIARALRKVKAAGLREAAEIVKEWGGSGFICDAIRAAADKAESGL